MAVLFIPYYYWGILRLHMRTADILFELFMEWTAPKQQLTQKLSNNTSQRDRDYFNTVAKRINAQLETIVSSEMRRLRQLNIPQPRLADSLRVRSNEIRFTEFRIPSHFVFPIVELDNINTNHRWEYLKDSRYCYVIVAHHADIKYAISDFQYHGLPYVVNKYEGGFYTRSPYAVFQHINAMPRYLPYTSIMEYDKSKYRPENWKYVELKPVGYTKDDIENIARKTRYIHESLAGLETQFPTPDEMFLTKPYPYYYPCIWGEMDLSDWSQWHPYRAFKIIPAEQSIPPNVYAQFFKSLNIKCPIRFSIESGKTITYQIIASPQDAEAVKRKLELFFPTAAVIEGGNWHTAEVKHGISFLPKAGILEPFHSDFTVDPFNQLFGIMEHSDKNIRLEVVMTPFPPSTLTALAKFTKKVSEYFEGEQLNEAKNRIKFLEQQAAGASPWAVKVAAFTEDESTARAINSHFFSQYAKNAGEIIPTDQYLIVSGLIEHQKKYPQHFVLTPKELNSLVHFSTSDLVKDRLETANMKAKLPPELYTKAGVIIGVSEARGQKKTVFLPEDVRNNHFYIAGKSGMGKSTIMETIALQDIENGMGCAILDPHGDMIEHILERIPDHRVQDCILFDPADCPVSLDILSADNEEQINLLTDDLLTMFKRLTDSWGDVMETTTLMVFQTLLRVPGSSFVDIIPLLTDSSFRAKTLSKIKNPVILSFWEHQYDQKQVRPLLTRLMGIIANSTMTQILTQHEKSLNFYDVVTEGKIFLGRLSTGKIGKRTSGLLGSIIVSQIQLGAMRQINLPQEQRTPFSLFVDEFQNFVSPAFAVILSEARKAKLRLGVAHQYISQLSQDIQKAVFGNVGTMIFFANSPDDLGPARHELGQYEIQDVANLPKYNALCRPATGAKDTFLMTTLPLKPPRIEPVAELVAYQTKHEYGSAQKKTEPTSTLFPDAPGHPIIDKSPKIEKMPARKEAPAFPTNAEKIMHYLRQAEYLSQPQINAVANLQASNASTALKKLVDSGQIKALDDRRPKIYYIGRTCNPTPHNLLIRDLFVKIWSSGYAIHSASFNTILEELKPDLTVQFIAEDGSLFTTYFEIDRGTEGADELVRKAERYKTIGADRVGFIFEHESDMEIVRKRITEPFIIWGVLNDFSALTDRAFYRGESNTKIEYFSS